MFAMALLALWVNGGRLGAPDSSRNQELTCPVPQPVIRNLGRGGFRWPTNMPWVPSRPSVHALSRPVSILPCQPCPANRPPSGPDWQHEFKWDRLSHHCSERWRAGPRLGSHWNRLHGPPRSHSRSRCGPADRRCRSRRGSRDVQSGGAGGLCRPAINRRAGQCNPDCL
jgi:hypothetical protein